MDIDLKLLGPYAKIYQEGFKSTSQKNQPTTKPNRANFGALHKKQNVKFLQDVDSKRKDKRTEMEESRKARRSTKFMNGRKTNMAEIATDINKYLHDETDESSEISALECIDTKSPDVTANNSKSKLVPDKANVNNNNKVAAAKTGTNQNQNKNNLIISNNRNINKPVPSSKVLPFSNLSQSQKDKDSRRDQLLKWKKEKEAADTASRRILKQPFKVGVVVGAKAVDNLAANLTNKNSKTFLASSTTSIGSKNSVVAAPKVPISTSSRKPLTGTSVAEDPRRVTRAMSKAQTVTSTGTKNVVSNAKSTTTQVMKPTIQKMKTLTIAEKGAVSRPGTAPVSSLISRTGPSSQPIKPLHASSCHTSEPALIRKPQSGHAGSTIKGIKAAPVKASASKPLSNTTPSDNVMDGPIANPVQKPPEVSKKKLKPKAIDAMYINYNAQFSDACKTLKSYSTEWTTILELKEEMEDDIQGDIHSALGKVKLLLESKLPQFGELLYSYLCQEMDPRPILPCDLEGWWDVASIQLEAIDKEFKGLHELRQNKWQKVSPLKPPKSAPSQECNGASNDDSHQTEAGKPLAPIRRTKPTISVKAKASGGLKAFLANQRKMLMGNEKTNTTVEAMDVSLPIKDDSFQEEKDICQDLNTSERKFDGKFFTINSPMAKHTPDIHTPKRKADRLSTSIRNNQGSPFLRTPSRRLSTTSVSSLKRMSFCILGVRQSMGSFNKIGAVAISADDQNKEVEN